ncbi:MAG: prolyl oligopeptidase family serine peptidase [Verrucomicrobiae bacterium]|nr:prolyl oligopeptidase family serine peptidase [Verrucomicrobiae bacterium]
MKRTMCWLPLLAVCAIGATLEYRAYPSSQDPSPKLYANFIKPDQPRPILLSMHGWHGQAKRKHADNVETVTSQPWFVIEPDMRGRGDSTGKPDANGWELQDAVDAVEFAKKEYAPLIATPECVYLTGGSGGGGNVLGLVGKFPDYFCAAVCECGISDYGLWFEHDRKGEFRDELEGKGWIGGTPRTNPEAYASRGGLTTVSNLLTPLAITHGELDPRCPVETGAQLRGEGKTRRQTRPDPLPRTQRCRREGRSLGRHHARTKPPAQGTDRAAPGHAQQAGGNPAARTVCRRGLSEDQAFPSHPR